MTAPWDGLRCYFCNGEAVTIGWGFALCGGRPDGEVNCSERARVLVTRGASLEAPVSGPFSVDVGETQEQRGADVGEIDT